MVARYSSPFRSRAPPRIRSRTMPGSSGQAPTVSGSGANFSKSRIASATASIISCRGGGGGCLEEVIVGQLDEDGGRGRVRVWAVYFEDQNKRATCWDIWRVVWRKARTTL